MSETFQPVNPQGQYRIGELNRMARRLESRKALNSRGMGTMQSQSGEVSQLAIQETFLAQITAGPSGDGSYTWQEVLEPTPGTFQPRIPGRSGAPGNYPAYEVNGLIIPVLPTIARLWLGQGYYYEFEEGGTGGGTLPVVQDTRYCSALAQLVQVGDTTIKVQTTAPFPHDPQTGLLLFPFQVVIDNETLNVVNGQPTSPSTLTLGAPATKFHYNYAPVCQPQPLIQTQLIDVLDKNTIQFNVVDPRNFPSDRRFYIQIDSEIMLMIDGAGTTIWTVQRARVGTQAAPHNPGTTIYFVLPEAVRNSGRLVFDGDDFVSPGNFDPTQEGNMTAVHQEVKALGRLTDTARTGNGYYPGVRAWEDLVNHEINDSYPIWIKNPNG